MVRNHYITIEKLEKDPETGEKAWSPVYSCHAAVNKASGREYLDAGAVQSQLQMVADVRYCSEIAALRLNTQGYRFLYNGGVYKIADYDDVQELHRSVKLLGVSYGG